jgi:hypothetical protein
MRSKLHTRKGHSTTVEEVMEVEVERGTAVATGVCWTIVVCTTVIEPAERTLVTTFGGAGEGYLKSQTKLKTKHKTSGCAEQSEENDG